MNIKVVIALFTNCLFISSCMECEGSTEDFATENQDITVATVESILTDLEYSSTEEILCEDVCNEFNKDNGDARDIETCTFDLDLEAFQNTQENEADTVVGTLTCAGTLRFMCK